MGVSRNAGTAKSPPASPPSETKSKGSLPSRAQPTRDISEDRVEHSPDAVRDIVSDKAEPTIRRETASRSDGPGDAGTTFNQADGEDVPDDNDDGTPRDPAIDRAFVKLTEALQGADNDLAKMLAIRECAEALEPLGDDEAIRELVGMGHACGISAENFEAMEGIVEQGLDRARLKRASRGQDGPRKNPNQDDHAVAIVPTPYRYRPASEIPRREWLYGRHYIRGAVTSTIAPGGYTKSTRSLTECIAMVTGRNLLGAAPAQRLRAWYWNGEDTRDEIERKIAAICKHHGIDAKTELGGLFYDSGHDMPIKIAKAGRGGPGSVILGDETIAQVMAAITGNQIDVVVFDPFISVHSVAESDNVAIDQVVKVFGRIADQTRCSIDFDHHTRKPSPGQTEITVDDARGGGAIVYGVRSCRIINRMSSKEAGDLGFSPIDRLSYFRIDKPKANFAPPEAATWCRVVSVGIDNGDSVGVIEPWIYPNAFDGVSIADVAWVRALVAGERKFRFDSQAKEWIGVPLAVHLRLDLNNKGDKAKVKRILKTWFKNGVLDIEEHEDGARKARKFVVVGTGKPDDTVMAEDGDIDP